MKAWALIAAMAVTIALAAVFAVQAVWDDRWGWVAVWCVYAWYAAGIIDDLRGGRGGDG